MNKFYCMTETGTMPPRYIHNSFVLAVLEAKRLHERLGCRVFILEVVGEVCTRQVPVTRPEAVLLTPGGVIAEKFDEKGILPF
jgi:hypothetical protein